ncbi:hypothetical protein [Microbacterium sp. UBA3394]|uniref:hypothetical protein n=1 Tax=Microbacterium sp. UBA3394 TaxID=1946945 RepID=UPI00257DF5BD|nr:hypothetical protein [Microbacterium sp. UBA3394]|tara:strand:+ start:3509 stop:4135 length:627 start_codon:yes stop_codon:yes gene_type:complete
MATTSSTRPLRSWVIGGSLLIVSAITTMVTSVTTVTEVQLWRTISAIAFASATVVFALGIPGGGSVTKRRPLGTIALIATGVLAVINSLLWNLISGPLVAMQTVGYLQLLIGLLAVIIAVTAIARAGIVPSPWNWAPTWALVALAVPQILVQAIAAANPADLQQAAQWISLLGVIVAVSAPILLGVIAIALAQRPAHREPTPILDSRD